MAQEICDDGIDNDGNGLIDLNDPGCACSGAGTTPSSLIPNPSFEDHTCCPTEFSEYTDFLTNCADTWNQPSTATADYFNTCDYTGPAPLPFPDGDAAAGFIIYNDETFLGLGTYLEYLGATFTSPLVNGTPYQLTMNVAFGFTDASVENSPSPLPPNPTCPIDLTIFGSPNASDIPWSGHDCPDGVGGFVEIGHVSYTPDATAGWGVVTINFTPTFDVYAIAIGGPCNIPNGCGYNGYPSDGEITIFYVDNLILNESASFSAQMNLSGALCTNDLVLSATSSGSGTYQWYYEGVAIVGETNQNLNVSSIGGTAGTYQVTYTEFGACVVQDTVVLDHSFNMSTSADQTICAGTSVTLTANGGVSYTWDNALPSNSSNTVFPNVSTVYHVTATNTYGCTDTASIAITCNPSPAPLTIVGDSIVCYDESGILDAGAGYASYLWSPGGATTRTITVSQSGNYSVTVNNPEGCQATDNIIFTELPILTVNITGSTAFCYGSNTILDAGSGYSHYTWSNGDTTQTTTVTASGMYYVTVINAQGCEGVDSITVTQNPEIIPNILTSKEYVCIGDEFNLSVTGAGPGGSYSWSNGLGTNQMVTATLLTTTDYYVTLTDALGCTEIGTISITGVEVPALVAIPEDTVLCKGSSINLTVNGASSYSWFPSYALSSSTGSVVIASPEVSTVYTVTGSNALGGTTCSSVIQVDVEVDQFNFTLPLNKLFCKGTTATASAIVTGGTAPYAYSWTINGLPATSTTSSITLDIDTVNNLQLIGVDDNGCIITKSTTYQNYPPLVIEPYINKDTVCPGDPVLFNASISGGTGYPYLFAFDGHFSNNILTVIPETTYTYDLEVSDGCETVTDQITIYTYPIPYLDFVADDYAGCMPKTIRFTSISSPADMISQYRWNFGDTDDNNLSLSPTPSHDYDNKGDYNVTLEVTTIHGCITDTTKYDLIHIEPKPELDFVAKPSVVSILDAEVLFENLSINKDSLTYVWDFGTGDLSNLQSPQYFYKNIGNYEVQMVGFTTYGCSDTVYKFVEVKPEVAFYVPEAFTPDGDAHNEFFISKGSNILKEGFKMVIYDRWGEPIFETSDINEGWNGKAKGGDFSKAGTYIYHIEYKDIYGIGYEKDGTIQLIR
ncbi:MAG: gliding motility-associated C-terminal domain-containing protein [Bacteroidales bacterium]|nr:gliding motility-associated C-terminal domain-containing protein [Bacteroidales bacterium]